MTATQPILDQDLITQLISRARGEEPVITLYMKVSGNERKTVLKNLIRDGEQAIDADTGWADERKKVARGILEAVRLEAESTLAAMRSAGRGSIALFGDANEVQALRLPLDMRDRLVVDRSPYASPLSSLIDQYERYSVVLCDQKRARLFDVYLGEISDWEEFQAERTPKSVTAKSSFQGLEELRREHHGNYVLHLHLQEIADRAFRRFKLRPFDRLILAGPKEVLPKLEEQLHSYLKQRVVAREQLPTDLNQATAREKILVIEAKVELEKETALLAEIRNRQGSSGLGTVGLDETLTSLFFGKVHTLVVMDDQPVMGRECPECHYLFERPEDAQEKSATLVECPLCKRPTRRVPDIVDEAVELAILSGARVEHIAYAKEDLKDLGGMAAILRFK